MCVCGGGGGGERERERECERERESVCVCIQKRVGHFVIFPVECLEDTFTSERDSVHYKHIYDY